MVDTGGLAKGTYMEDGRTYGLNAQTVCLTHIADLAGLIDEL